MKLIPSFSVAAQAVKSAHITASHLLSITAIFIILRLLLLGCSANTIETSSPVQPGFYIRYSPSGHIMISVQSPLHLGHIHAPAKNEQDKLKR